MRIVPPVVISYTTRTVLVKQPRKRRNPKRFLVMAGMLLVVLIVGMASGGYTVWQSKFGVANDVANPVVDVAPVIADTISQPIPLDFKESDLNIVANMLPLLIEQNRHEPTAAEKLNQERKNKLRVYLNKYKSPLAKDDKALDALLNARNMKMILAISFVEGNFCQHQQYYNCSGIGGSSGFRHYSNFAEWVKDFDNLLEKRYKNLDVEDFIGVYVQPGSQNWVDGVHSVLDELGQGKIE